MVTNLTKMTGMPRAYVESLMASGVAAGASGVEEAVGRLVLVDALARLRIQGRLTRGQAARAYHAVTRPVEVGQ
jgi:hypothetical protein